MKIFVNTGHLSVDNGAKFPITYFADMCKVIGTSPIWGQFYGDDSLEIEENILPTVIELLEENNMLYMIVGQHKQWQNIKTNSVADRLKVTLPA